MNPRSTHPRWRRQVHVRREALRRDLAISAVLGIGGGIAGFVLVRGEAGSELVLLIRLAMMLPAAIFVTWWMVGPGLSIDQVHDAEAPVTDPQDLAERIRAVEHVFDNVAVPAAKRAAREDEREWFRASINRDTGIDHGERETWGLPHNDALPPRSADQI